MIEASQVSEGIAIIGMSGRFPASKNVEEYWRNLCGGVECISFFTDQELIDSGVPQRLITNPAYVRAAGVIEGVSLFDAEFFGFSPREAEITDPQQRLFLECAWEALESSGYNPETYNGPIGVYAGASLSNYLFMLRSNLELVELIGGFQIEISNDKDFLSTRASYKLNLSGPSININTACSSSLVAVAVACQSLLHHQCDIALAGGVSIHLPQKVGYLYEKGGIRSADGHCRAFDEKAQGVVGGSGVGVVALKRAEDAFNDGDEIIAVIKGSAVNNDGALKVGFTAPSAEGQAAVIWEAIAAAGVDPESITYVEAHGTGTSLGDPIEVEALTRAFRFGTDTKGFCALGSVKTNIGHLDTASGVAGLIKAALAVKHGVIPASLHYTRPNPQLNLENSPFYVNTHLREWRPESVRRAGVSSFGIGGTNAHVVLEEAPAPWVASPSRRSQLMLVSGRSPAALQVATVNLQNHLRDNSVCLADVAHTLAVGRKHFSHRLAFVCGDSNEAVDSLATGNNIGKIRGIWDGSHRAIAMLFTGQGSQFVNMGRDLYQQERLFRKEIDSSSEYLKPLMGLDVREVMFATDERKAPATALLRQTWITQPALFILESSLLKLWQAWGVTPTVMIGHSLGELVAAVAAGTLSQEDALRLVVARGRLMWETEPGAMLSAGLSADTAQQFVRPGVSIAAINGREQVVFSGDTQEIKKLAEAFNRTGIACRQLSVERAFHSEKMERIRDQFLEVVGKLRLNKPTGRYVSNVTGEFAGHEVTDAEYWWQQMRSPVKFAAGIDRLKQEDDWIWLEVGPGESLSRLVRNELVESGIDATITASLPGEQHHEREQEKILQALGALWASGAQINWDGYYCDERRRRVQLPTYPFQRKSYWAQIPAQAAAVTTSPTTQGISEVETSQPGDQQPNFVAGSEDLPDELKPEQDIQVTVSQVWKKLLGTPQITASDNFFDLGGHSLLLIQMARLLSEKLKLEIPLEDFLKEPTIAGLVRRLKPVSNGSAHRSVLAPFRTSGTRPPFFGVHPVGGGTFIYRQLADHLGPDQPFYGLQALGLAEIADQGDPYNSLKDMASEYLQAVRQARPHGPYFLGGLSWGGVLAFEIAQQMYQAGEEVRLLALFDTPAPAELAKLCRQDDAEILVGLARDLGFQQGIELQLSVDMVRSLPEEQQFQRVLTELQSFGLMPGETTSAWLRRHLHGYRSRLDLVRNYRPEIFPGRITFFRASDMDSEMTRGVERLQLDYHNPSFAWDKLSTEPVEIFKVPGNHSEMVNEPHVQVLAEYLSNCIARQVSCAV